MFIENIGQDKQWRGSAAQRICQAVPAHGIPFPIRAASIRLGIGTLLEHPFEFLDSKGTICCNGRRFVPSEPYERHENMRAHPTISVILLSSAFCASTTAQSVNQVPKPSDQPVGEVPTSAATVISAATATLVNSNLAPDEIISIRRLPSVAELKAAAGAQGLVVEKIVLTDAQITAVYRNTSNQSHTVCYQFLQAIDSQPQSTIPATAAVAPVLVPVPTPAPVSQAMVSSEAIPEDDYPTFAEPVYYPGYYPLPWFGGVSVNSRVGSHAYRGYYGGTYRGATYHGGTYRGATYRGGTYRGGTYRGGSYGGGTYRSGSYGGGSYHSGGGGFSGRW
jgi:hypothetical protein